MTQLCEKSEALRPVKGGPSCGPSFGTMTGGRGGAVHGPQWLYLLRCIGVFTYDREILHQFYPAIDRANTVSTAISTSPPPPNEDA
jgi:hypothetical protein